MNELPLISCIMPTYNRRPFIAHAIACFLSQDWPNKELIIIDNGTDPVEDVIPPALENVFYCRVGAPRRSLGFLRNYGASWASGSLICHWDDDDYYGCHRLSAQAIPLLSGPAAVTGLHTTYVLHLPELELWQCSEEQHNALWAIGCRDGTLLYEARWFHAVGLRYPDHSAGQDTQFLRAIMNRGARLGVVNAPREFVNVRHTSNISDPVEGVCEPLWRRVPLEEVFDERERAFYRSLSETLTPRPR